MAIRNLTTEAIGPNCHIVAEILSDGSRVYEVCLNDDDNNSIQIDCINSDSAYALAAMINNESDYQIN